MRPPQLSSAQFTDAGAQVEGRSCSEAIDKISCATLWDRNRQITGPQRLACQTNSTFTTQEDTGARKKPQHACMRRVRTGPSCIAPVFDKYLSPRRYHSSEQVTVDFTGSPSSQEINGTFAAVSCDLVLSPASVSTLGNGHTCQFVSGSSLKVPEHVLFAFQGLLDFRCEAVKRIVAGLRWSRMPPLQALGRACTCTEGGGSRKT